MNIDVSTVVNREAKIFINQFLIDRRVNRDFYDLIPESNLDYRMVHTAERKSDSPRESIIHQISITRKYIYGAKAGKLEFEGIAHMTIDNAHILTKPELLHEFDASTQEVIELLSSSNIANMKVSVPWSKEAIFVIQSLWGLRSHEILHTGWNLALMDHLNIARYDSLRSMWG